MICEDPGGAWSFRGYLFREPKGLWGAAPAFKNRKGRRSRRRDRREFQEPEDTFWKDRNPAGERSSPGFYDCLLRIRPKSLRRGRVCFVLAIPDSKKSALSSRPCWRWRRRRDCPDARR